MEHSLKERITFAKLTCCFDSEGSEPSNKFVLEHDFLS